MVYSKLVCQSEHCLRLSLPAFSYMFCINFHSLALVRTWDRGQVWSHGVRYDVFPTYTQDLLIWIDIPVSIQHHDTISRCIYTTNKTCFWQDMNLQLGVFYYLHRQELLIWKQIPLIADKKFPCFTLLVWFCVINQSSKFSAWGSNNTVL